MRKNVCYIKFENSNHVHWKMFVYMYTQTLLVQMFVNIFVYNVWVRENQRNNFFPRKARSITFKPLKRPPKSDLLPLFSDSSVILSAESGHYFLHTINSIWGNFINFIKTIAIGLVIFKIGTFKIILRCAYMQDFKWQLHAIETINTYFESFYQIW